MAADLRRLLERHGVDHTNVGGTNTQNYNQSFRYVLVKETLARVILMRNYRLQAASERELEELVQEYVDMPGPTAEVTSFLGNKCLHFSSKKQNCAR